MTKPPSDPLTPAEEKLVDDLAAQAGLVLRNVRLIEELGPSRSSAPRAADRGRAGRARRRLERNIHDGAQQQLVALAVKLRLARTPRRRETRPRRARVLDELQGEAQDALENLRDLARGIYPPLLADQGLVAALDGAGAQGGGARRRSRPTASAATRRRSRRPSTSAAWRRCRTSRSTRTRPARAIALRERRPGSRFEVTDDGAGFDPAATGYGTGLQGMADRLAALDGTIEVRSAPGSGTTLTGRIPLDDRLA